MKLLILLFCPVVAFAQLGPLPPNANVTKDSRGRTVIHVPPGAGDGPIRQLPTYDLGNTTVRQYDRPSQHAPAQSQSDISVQQGSIPITKFSTGGKQKARPKEPTQPQQVLPMLPSESGGRSGGYACANSAEPGGTPRCTQW